MNTKIYNDSLRTLRELIKSVIKEKGVTVLLFGSRATGEAATISDNDIGLIFKNRGAGKLLTLSREKIENSNIPYKVDLVDLSLTSKKFRRKALAEAKVLWKS